MHAPIHLLPRRLSRHPRAETLVTVITGVFIGSLVIGGFWLFWLHADEAKHETTDRTQQEASGLTVLNRISRDVSDASAVALADDDQLVLDHSTGATTTRIGYVVDADGSVYRVTRANAPVTFDPANPGWGPESRRQYLARGVRAAADGAPFFSFTTTDGGTLSAGDLPAYTPGMAASIKRVDIAFAAKVGDTKTNAAGVARDTPGYVELHTSATLNTGPGGEVDPHVPACPLPHFVQGDPYPIIRWNMTGQTTSFEVRRDGVLVTTPAIAADTSDEYYRFVDPSREGTTTPVDYQVTAVGPGGSSVGCGSIRWYPRLLTPNASTRLYAQAAESYHWVGSGYNAATVRISWTPVTYANGYEVYRRPLTNTSPYSSTSGYRRVALITSGSTTSFTDSGLPWDTAYEYHVVANGPMPEASKPTVGMKVLTHTAAPTRATATPVGYYRNRVNWTPDPGETATGYAVYRRDTTGCFTSLGSWRRVYTTTNLDQTSWTDTNAPLSTEFQYAVGAYNRGPRGGTADLQYASLLSRDDTALQFPDNPTTTATGSYTSPGGTGRSYLNSGYKAYNVGISNVAWSPDCAATTDTYRLDLYGSSRSNPYAMLEMGTQRSWKDQGWHPRATERNYKAVAFNATGPSPNTSSTAGLASAYQYSKQPSRGSTSVTRSRYTVYSGYTDNNVRPSGAQGSCYSRTVDVDDSHWEAGWDRRWVPTTYETYWNDTSHQANGHPRKSVHGHAPTRGSHWHSHGRWDTRVDEPGHWETYWNTRKTWVPDSDGDLVDYRWYCWRYKAGYTVTWNEAADTGESSNPFCRSGRGGCTATVYWTDTGANRQTTASGDGPHSRTYWWYTARVDGHDYSYWVNQPDGTISCNVGGCASSENDTDCTSNCTPGTAGNSPLPAPAFSVLGSDTNNDQVADALGTNRVMWNKVPDADGYRIYRYSSYSGGNVSTSAGDRTLVYTGQGYSCSVNGYSRCWYDTGKQRGTETFYKVVAYNATYIGESTIVRAGYQAPASTTLTRTKKATLDDRTVGWAWTKVADGGMTRAGKFCASAQNSQRGECSYQLTTRDVINNRPGRTYDLGADVGDAKVAQAWGKRLRYTLHACNKGGCTRVASPIDSDTWPGPFEITDQQTEREAFGQRWHSNTLQDVKADEQTATIGWSRSKNATKYKFGFAEKAGDPFNLKFPAGYDGRFRTAANNGTNIWTGKHEVTPGARYTYTAWAVAENGRRRKAETKVFLSRPPMMMFLEDARFCKPSDPALNARGWRNGWRVHIGGRVTDSASGQQRDIGFDRIRWAWWAGMVPNKVWTDPDSDARGRYAVQQIVRTRTGNTKNPDNWRPAQWDNGTEFYDNAYESGGMPADNTVKEGILGGPGDGRLIPWKNRTWEGIAWYSWLNPNQHPSDLGHHQTNSLSFHNGNDGIVNACRGSGAGWVWNGDNGIVGRWANENSGIYFVAPYRRVFGTLSR